MSSFFLGDSYIELHALVGLRTPSKGLPERIEFPQEFREAAMRFKKVLEGGLFMKNVVEVDCSF